jgi:hypothetical protein
LNDAVPRGRLQGVEPARPSSLWQHRACPVASVAAHTAKCDNTEEPQRGIDYGNSYPLANTIVLYV